jgi:Putative peptidoglycan binding domain
MKTRKSFRTNSNHRLLLMVPVISFGAFARQLEEKANKRLPRIKAQSVSLSMLTALATFLTAPGLMSQTMLHIASPPVERVQVPSIHLNQPPQFRTNSSNFRIAEFPGGSTQLPHPLVSAPVSGDWARINGRAAYIPNLIPTLGMAGLPAGPSQAPYPVPRTVANDALVRSNAWAAYNASVHPNTGLQTAETSAAAQNPNRLASRQNSLDQDRFIQMPQSSGRYNFQFSDYEIRSVQAALRRLGIYSGQVDGILGPDTRQAVEDYQVENKLPVTGQPDQRLNALLGI